jgi:ribonuclease VapC
VIAIDTSAVVAIALEEDEKVAFADRIVAGGGLIGAPTLLECRLVLASRMPASADAFMQGFLARPSVHPLSFTVEMYVLAADAFARFGKGRGNSARLNFGDCMSYAVARHHDIPLLYKGSDFSFTDIRSAA